MATKFTTKERDVLTRCGWDVGQYDATRWETCPAGRRALARVDPAGRWTVHHVPHENALAWGKDDCACSAAMDANEVLWAWRDARKVPDHLRTKLTTKGREVL